MKKVIIILSIFLTVATAKTQTAVSIAPEYYILQNIAKDKVDILLMVDKFNDPHSYEPKPSKIAKLSKVKLYFSIGVEFEKRWLERFKSINPSMQIIDLSKGIKKIPNNPHVWTTPKNVKIIAQNIYHVLIKSDSKNKNYYQSNLEKFINMIDNIDKKIQNMLKECSKKKCLLLAQHPAWSYFAKEYGIKEIVIEKDEKEPKPKELLKTIKLIKQSGAKIIITQPELSKKFAKIVAKELNLQMVDISPLDMELHKSWMILVKSILN